MAHLEGHEEWISRAQAARLKDVCPTTVDRWIMNGAVESKKLDNGKRLVSRSSLIALKIPYMTP
jgi:hypothetical protein